MGITSTLYDEYYNKEIVSNKLETPFGEVTMIKSGQKIPFEYFGILLATASFGRTI